jgi:hypothetical protein
MVVAQFVPLTRLDSIQEPCSRTLRSKAFCLLQPFLLLCVKRLILLVIERITVSKQLRQRVVCRIDFEMAGQDVSPRVNRLVLYVDAQRMSFMIAIGQDIAPLPINAPVISAE